MNETSPANQRSRGILTGFLISLRYRQSARICSDKRDVMIERMIGLDFYLDPSRINEKEAARGNSCPARVFAEGSRYSFRSTPMPKEKDPQSEPHVQDTQNDPPPGKGTNEPWRKPGQSSQNPDEPEPAKPDLEKWHKSSTH